MTEYTAETYGESWVDFYDDPLLGWPAADKTVEFLRSRIVDNRALDLGAGTGRVAIPLARTGVEVTAVDISDGMLAKIREKSDAENLYLIQDDIRSFTVDKPFGLIYCIGQSFLQLQSQSDQRSALIAMRDALTDGGKIIIECLTPDIRRFRVGQDQLTNRITPDEVISTFSVHHPAEQRIESMTTRTGRNGVRMYPNFIRYLWPSELVLLAELVGLEVTDRFGSWSGAPYRGGPGAYVVELRKSAAYEIE